MADTTASGPPPAAAAPVDPTRPALKLPTKVLYGFGSVAYGAAGITISSALLTYYLNRVMGLPALWVGTVLMLTLMADAILDPLIGQFSDSLRTRLGRRHPLMYAAAPLTALVLFAFYNASPNWSEAMLGAYLIAFLVALRLCISLYEVPSSSLAPELTPNYHERTGLMSYRYFFGVIGGLVMNVVLYRVYLSDESRGGMLNREAYGDYAVLAGAVIFFSIIVSALGTQREVMRFPSPGQKQTTLSEVLKDASITLTNRSLLVVMTSGLLSGVAAGLGASLTLYFQVELWRLNAGQIGYLQFAGLPVSFLAVILATPISKAFGKKNAMIGVFSVSFVTGMIPLFLNLVGVLPSDGSALVFWVLFIDAIIAGTLGITGFIIVSSMIVDIVEDAAVQTGRRSEGLLLATNGLLPKFTNAIGVWVGGIVLTLVNFPRTAPQGTVDMEIMRQLAMFYLPIYAVMTGLAIAVLGWYRIDQETHERNVATLAQAATRAEEASEAQDGAGGPTRPGPF